MKVCPGQVGSGAPAASAGVQRQSKAATDTQDKAVDLEKWKGQALDRDAAALATVPPDPLFRRDILRLGMEPFDRTFNQLRKSEGLTFAASYTLVDQYATATPAGVRHNWATGRFDLTGGWKLYDHGSNAGSLSLLVRSGVNLGGESAIQS